MDARLLARPALALLGLLALGSAPAAAQEQGSVGLAARNEAENAFAIAGDEAVYDRGDGSVVALPIGPGGAPSIRYRVQVPEAGDVEVRLDGDASGLAAAAVLESRTSTFASGQLLAAPLGSPLVPVAPKRRPTQAYTPAQVQRDEGRVFTFEVLVRKGLRSRIVVREPGRMPVRVALPPDAVFTAVFAGELVAYATARRGDPDDSDPQLLALAAWRTGRVLRRVVIPGGVESLDLRADGRVAVGRDGGGVLEVLPGRAAPRVVSPDGKRPVYAGEAIVFVREVDEVERMAIAGPGLRPRPFGPPSETIEGPVANGRRVLHRANGCLLATAVDAPATTAPVGGLCPRGELILPTSQGNPILLRDGSLPVLLRCVAAEAAGCVGRAELRFTESRLRPAPPVAVRIAPGAERRVVFRLTRAGVRAVRRMASDGFGAPILVRATIVDSLGRRSVLERGEVAVPARRRRR